MNRPQMLTDVLSDKRAWYAGTIDDVKSWYYSLSEKCLFAFDTYIRYLRCYPQPITEIRIQKSLFDICTESLQPVADALNTGLGFAIVERIPLEQYTLEESRIIYWLLGQFLGHPFAQDIKGTLLYDVKDTGQSVTQGARFSVTKAESSFHMDNSFGNPVPDFVGLLCVKTAKSGGQNQLISAYSLHNELREQFSPDVLETLYQPFYFDRRGQFNMGESSTSDNPIFQWDQVELTMRYMYYYIQIGHQRAGQALTPNQEKALNILEMLLCRSDLRVEFSLKPGQMLFTNNHWILHNRTLFEDYPDPKCKRHYVRLWLQRRTSSDGPTNS